MISRFLPFFFVPFLWLCACSAHAQVHIISADTTKPDTTHIVSDPDAGMLVVADTVIANDTSKMKKHRIKRPKTPWKAAVMSACVPGLGQLYNEKWWKAPIVWGALGTVGYFIVTNHNQFIGFRDAYRQVVKGGKYPLGYQDYSGNSAGLRTQRDYYQRTRDILIIVGAALWALNIVDASVDAHLSTFDVSEDLSMRLQPVGGYVQEIQQPYVGMSLSFHFRNKK